MGDLKNSWKQVEKDLDVAFTNLGKTLVKTAKVGIDKLDTMLNNNTGSDQKKK